MIRLLHRLMSRHGVLMHYSGSTALQKLTAMLASIAVLHWIQPADMGIWQALILVQSYGEILRLGITRGLNRELPFLLGQGRDAEAMQAAATAQLHSLITGMFGSTVLLAGLLVPAWSSPHWRTALVAMAVTWFAGSYGNCLQATFRGHKEFQKLAYRQYFTSLLNVVSLAMVAWWGFSGMVWRTALIAVVNTLFLHQIRPFRLPLSWNWHAFRNLLSTGLPLYGSNCLMTVAQGFNSIILLGLGGVELLGLYAPVSAILSVMDTIPQSFTAYANPRLVYGLGQNEQVRPVWRGAVRVSLAAVGVTIPIALVGWLLLPWAFTHVFPHYAPAVTACSWALLAGLFWALGSLRVALVVTKAWSWLYVYACAFVFLKWIFPWYFANRLPPLNGLMIGETAAAVCLLVVAVWVSFRATHAPTPSLHAGSS